MQKIRYIFILLLISIFNIHAQTDQEYNNLIQAFTIIRTNTIWPVQGASFDDIEETYGPRIKPSTDDYDHHQGIDIDWAHGSNVVAVLDGEFFRYNDEGIEATVILKHPFPQPIQYNGQTFSNFFTSYVHMDNDSIPQFIKDAEQDQTTPAISQGQQLGIMNFNDSGPHCHLNLYIGRHFQDDDGFEPKMHPMLLFPPDNFTNGYEIILQQLPILSGTEFQRIRVISTKDELPILNRFEANIINKADNSIAASHLLDLNRYIGFVNTSIETLDNPDRTKPYLDPEKFVDAQTNYTTQFVIPISFAKDFFDPDRYRLEIKVADIWGTQSSTLTNEMIRLAADRKGADLDGDSKSDIILQKKHTKLQILSRDKNNIFNNLKDISPPLNRGEKIVAAYDLDVDTQPELIIQKGKTYRVLTVNSNLQASASSFQLPTLDKKFKIGASGLIDTNSVIVASYKKQANIYIGANKLSYTHNKNFNLVSFRDVNSQPSLIIYAPKERELSAIPVVINSNSFTLGDSIDIGTLPKKFKKPSGAAHFFSNDSADIITTKKKELYLFTLPIAEDASGISIYKAHNKKNKPVGPQ